MRAVAMEGNVSMLPQRGIECVARKMINKGALIAVCDIRVNGWHMVLKDCKWFRKDNKSWIGLPTTNFKDRDGKVIYKTIVDIYDKDAYARFQAAALEAVETFRD